MKKVLFVLLLVATSLANAQEKLSFEKVIPVEGVDKQTLFVGIKEWIGLNFNSAKSVIEVEDKEAGLIVGKSNIEYEKSTFGYGCYGGWLNFNIRIQCRDGRFKVELTNFVHEIKKGNSDGCQLGLLTTATEYGKGGLQKKFNNNVWKDLKEKAETLSLVYFTDLSRIDFNGVSDNNDDW
jgi:hypothetical protein